MAAVIPQSLEQVNPEQVKSVSISKIDLFFNMLVNWA